MYAILVFSVSHNEGSLVRPKVRKSVHYAKDTKSFWFQEYRDATMISSELPVSAVYPTEVISHVLRVTDHYKDPDGNRLQTEYGFCRYVDFQTITIQEMPERSPAGQLPRSVDVVLNADLVDSVKPGDRVRIYGVYRSLGGVGSGSTNAVFRCDYLNESINFSTVVIANHLIQLIKSVYSRPISEMDIQAIKKISKRKDAVDLLASSLAPSIYGHELIKKAILLQLLGGTEKNLTNGTHIRG
jgi:DNA replication licensing factor MCM3